MEPKKVDKDNKANRLGYVIAMIALIIPGVVFLFVAPRFISGLLYQATQDKTFVQQTSLSILVSTDLPILVLIPLGLHKAFTYWKNGK